MLKETFRKLMLDRIEPKNYPEGYKIGPTCPHTYIVTLCSALAGTLETDPRRFCGEIETNQVHSRGYIPWLKSADYIPASSCFKANEALLDQLEIARTTILKPSEGDLKQQIQQCADASKYKGIIAEYEEELRLYNIRSTTMDRWRLLVFETCVARKEDIPASSKNVHTRGYDNPNELSEDYIVSQVSSFTRALEGITGLKNGSIATIYREAIHCPQSPRHHSIGKY